jgi:hypothetical protein
MPKSSATGATNSANDSFVGGSGLLIDGGGGPTKPVRVDKFIISEHKQAGSACIKSQPDLQNPVPFCNVSTLETQLLPTH